MELVWRRPEPVQSEDEFEDSADYAAEAGVGPESPFTTADNWDQCSMDLCSSDESDASSQRGGYSGAPPKSRADSTFLTKNTKYSNVPPKNSAKSGGSSDYGASMAGNGAGSGVRLPKGISKNYRGKALAVIEKHQFWREVLFKWHKTELANEKTTKKQRGQASRRRNRYLNSKVRSKKKRAAQNVIKYAINKKCRALCKAADETEPEPGWAERQKDNIKTWRAEREAKPDWAESQLKFILKWRLMNAAYFYRHYERAIRKEGLKRIPKALRTFAKKVKSAFPKPELREKAFIEEEKARVRKWAQEVWGSTVDQEQPEDDQAVHAGSIEDVTPSIEMTQNYLLRKGQKNISLTLLHAALAQALAPHSEMVETPIVYSQPEGVHPNVLRNACWFLKTPPAIRPVLLSAPKKPKINLSLPGVGCNLLTGNSGRLEVLRQAPLNRKPGLLETPKNMQLGLSQEAVGKDLAPGYPMPMGRQLACLEVLRQAPLNRKPGLLETPKNMQLGLSQEVVGKDLAPGYPMPMGRQLAWRQAHVNLKPALLETPRILPLVFPIRPCF